jgi:hypothetical protein
MAADSSTFAGTKTGNSSSIALLTAACQAAPAPPNFRVVELEGGPYERGLQHGRRFPGEIRSLYTRMLTSSILPYLNRERPDVAAVLTEYQGALYDDGQFSFQLLLQSAHVMEPLIPDEAREEMRGIADGAGLPYEEILVLNTFLDSMLALRAITMFLRSLEAPHVDSVIFGDGALVDGVDNDGDGELDEADEGRLAPYEPMPHASMAEVPLDASVRFVLVDQAGIAAALGGQRGEARAPEGVDPDSIRLQVGTEVIEAPDPQITTRPVTLPDGAAALEVTFRPSDGLPPASVVSILISAGDLSVVSDPPPAHARLMRDERIIFTTEGMGRAPTEVDNRGEPDGRTQPPSLGFAVRGSATAGGETLMAHHFSLLDANTAHEHTALFVHHVDEGIDHVVLGWTGLVWGFSGMNAAGLSLGIQPSDSLDNGMMVDIAIHLGDLSAARLVTVGVPVGVMARKVLATARTTEEATVLLEATPRTFGWNMLIADRDGDIRVAEMDADILGDGGFAAYPAGDDGGSPGGSVGPDDLRVTCHYLANREDAALPPLRPQRFWSSFYFRSLRAIPGLHVLGDPEMSVLAIGSATLDVWEIGDEMSARGWHLDRQQFPASLHLTVNRAHVESAGRFLEDLAAAARIAPPAARAGALGRAKDGLLRAAVRVLPARVVTKVTEVAASALGLDGGELPERKAAMYGLMASLPNRGDLATLVKGAFDRMMRYAPESEIPIGPGRPERAATRPEEAGVFRLRLPSTSGRGAGGEGRENDPLTPQPPLPEVEGEKPTSTPVPEGLVS